MNLLPLHSIAADALWLTGDGPRAVMECPTLAFGIKGELEQRAVVDAWASLLNSLVYPLQIVIRSRQMNFDAVAPPPTGGDQSRARLEFAYKRLLDQLADQRRVIDRRFYVVVPGGLVAKKSRSISSEALEVLDQRVRWVAECLRRLDLEPKRLNDCELAELVRWHFEPSADSQPIGAKSALTSTEIAELIAPSAFAERPSHVSIGGQFATTITVSHYPSRLRPGWLGDLQSFEGDLDLALHVQPGTTPSVMTFLQRRVAELSSTIQVTEGRGGRADPYRRAALQDALDLQDRIAQGTERIFDTSLFLTLWASTAEELDALTRRVEALLGAHLLHTRRLLFQMRLGLMSTLPLGLEQVGVRRLLSTTALSATFPFTGSDLPARGGLLYGINKSTKSPVLLDRFALENHNAVIFATSGAGKSYLVKIEVARALQAGIRVLVIDPEGEYANLVSALGGAVLAVRPGSPFALNPFAIATNGPGAIDSRIGSITTLVELLVEGLTPKERAGVAEAISFVYARAGFRDGASARALTPPRLCDVQTRLRTMAGLDDLAMRLERYVSGSGRWLFEQSASNGPAVDAIAYVLAGLPEEERTPAMFLVLEHIWSSLTAPAAPTLVVVDEAWWLMRHSDTARFLFRLVKTARKRQAGLTLVTQDVGDVIANPDGEVVIDNSALQILMKQAPQAMPRLADLFRLTVAEQNWLLNAQRGEGLLVAQGKRVPFQVVASEEEGRLIDMQMVAA